MRYIVAKRSPSTKVLSHLRKISLTHIYGSRLPTPNIGNRSLETLFADRWNIIVLRCGECPATFVSPVIFLQHVSSLTLARTCKALEETYQSIPDIVLNVEQR